VIAVVLLGQWKMASQWVDELGSGKMVVVCFCSEGGVLVLQQMLFVMVECASSKTAHCRGGSGIVELWR
jgi:hypothetical protein